MDSHLHPAGSFDLADHPVPTGREEIWRFTPLKRLRGLHDDADRGQARPPARGTPRRASASRAWTWPTSRGVRGISGLVPGRPLRRPGDGRGPPSTLLVDVPADTELAEPVMVDLDGQ